jgi:hypothetical protein
VANTAGSADFLSQPHDEAGATPMPAAAFAWFEGEGLLRSRIVSDDRGDVTEDVRPPVVALGPKDDDFVWAPIPERQRYPGKPLAEMTVEEYNAFLYRWFEAGVRSGEVRCAQCGRLILDDYEDLPDRDTWDAILIEQELVAWMVVHFDCKKPLPKKLKGMNPFDLQPRDPPTYDLSGAEMSGGFTTEITETTEVTETEGEG